MAGWTDGWKVGWDKGRSAIGREEKKIKREEESNRTEEC